MRLLAPSGRVALIQATQPAGRLRRFAVPLVIDPYLQTLYHSTRHTFNRQMFLDPSDESHTPNMDTATSGSSSQTHSSLLAGRDSPNHHHTSTEGVPSR